MFPTTGRRSGRIEPGAGCRLVLARTSDRLWTGVDVAIGRPYRDPTAPVTVPAALWGAPETVVDTLSGDVLVGTTPAFIGVTITQPPPPAALSESGARRFLLRFADELERAERTFTTAEATEQLQRHFPGAPMASERQASRLLRELRPSSWSSGGRRREHTVPGPDQLAGAAAVALESLR
jgi:hypothetical protein